jgi:hypothetical protein
MPQPFLHLGNVRIVGQGVGGRCRPHGMHTDARDGVNQADLTGIIEFIPIKSSVAKA